VPLAEAQQEIASIGNALSSEYPPRIATIAFGLDICAIGLWESAEKSLWLLDGGHNSCFLLSAARMSPTSSWRGDWRDNVEIAIRIAIGAGRTRIVRQLLTESCLLAVLGGLCGYVLTVAHGGFCRNRPVNIPRLANRTGRWSILAFALVVALINGAVSGMAPAFRAVRGRVTAHDFGAQGSAGAVETGFAARLWLLKWP